MFQNHLNCFVQQIPLLSRSCWTNWFIIQNKVLTFAGHEPIAVENQPTEHVNLRALLASQRVFHLKMFAWKKIKTTWPCIINDFPSAARHNGCTPGCHSTPPHNIAHLTTAANQVAWYWTWLDLGTIFAELVGSTPGAISTDSWEVVNVNMPDYIVKIIHDHKSILATTYFFHVSASSRPTFGLTIWIHEDDKSSDHMLLRIVRVSS